MYRQLFLAAIVAIALTLLSPALAQRGVPPPGGGDKNLRDGVSDVKGRSNEIERMKRDTEKPASDPAPNFPQIKEDFERIQIINSDTLQSNASGAALDYKLISEAASEIKKRATRLKSNMFASVSEKPSKEKERDAEEQQDLQSLLTMLDNAITSFAHSPIFQNIKVVNPQDSTKAKQDLEKVIKLSTRIGKEADKMKKANGN